jgi:hypothetical protein
MSAIDPASLHDELRALARGRGIRETNLVARVGPSLRQLAALEDGPIAAFRPRLVAFLRALLTALPGDLRRVAEIALGLDPDADQRILTQRLGLLAAELERDPRTIRRYYEEAFQLLAEAAAAVDSAMAGPDGENTRSAHREAPAGRARASEPAAVFPDLWYVEQIWAVLRVDGPAPELFEFRRVVALEDGVAELALSMSLPRAPGAPESPRDLGIEILFGGRMVRVDRHGNTVFAPVLRLPRPLGRYERHDFACIWRVPIGQPMAPHYALNPMVRCDALDLRVRFPEDTNPLVQRLDGLPLRVVEDLAVDLPAVALDGAFEASARFTRLATGRCYGLRWRP